MLLGIIALYSVSFFVCHKAKISRELGFSQVAFSISSRRVEIYFSGCENQSKEIYVLFVISEPQNTGQSRSLANNISNNFGEL